MIEFISTVTERVITFDNIKLDNDWHVRHAHKNGFAVANVRIKIRVDLSDRNNPVMTFNGEIFDEDKNTILSGQVLESLMDSPLRHNRIFLDTANIWKKYHAYRKTDDTPVPKEVTDIFTDSVKFTKFLKKGAHTS